MLNAFACHTATVSTQHTSRIESHWLSQCKANIHLFKNEFIHILYLIMLDRFIYTIFWFCFIFVVLGIFLGSADEGFSFSSFSLRPRYSRAFDRFNSNRLHFENNKERKESFAFMSIQMNWKLYNGNDWSDVYSIDFAFQQHDFYLEIICCRWFSLLSTQQPNSQDTFR